MNNVHDLLGAYCTHSLDADERAAFEGHVHTCGECRTEVADFREVLAALADAHTARPPSSLEDHVVAAARGLPGRSASVNQATSDQLAPASPEPALEVCEARPGAPTASPVPSRGVAAATGIPPVHAGRRAALGVAAAAAGAILFAGGVVLGRGQTPVESAASADNLAAVVAVASAADARLLPVDFMGTTSRVVMSQEMDKAVFLASEVSTPAKGMVYQVWSVTDDGQMLSAGAFTPADDGHIAVVLDGGAAAVDKFMITLEPPGGSEHPTGRMLAEVDI